MKRLFFSSLLAIMLSACVIQPVSARENKIVHFAFGLITGVFPIIGQAIAMVIIMDTHSTSTIGEDISFAAGHALGMTVWALPWYRYIAYTVRK